MEMLVLAPDFIVYVFFEGKQKKQLSNRKARQNKIKKSDYDLLAVDKQINVFGESSFKNKINPIGS